MAAAARALKTIQAQASIPLEDKSITDKETIAHLRINCSTRSTKNVVLNENADHYQHNYCVGYSVFHYTLDDAIIGSLIAQRGKIAQVNVIATFLPKVVIES